MAAPEIGASVLLSHRPFHARVHRDSAVFLTDLAIQAGAVEPAGVRMRTVAAH
jgi:hypothetical protein